MRKKTTKPAKKPARKGLGVVLNADKLLEREIELIFEDHDQAGNEYDFFIGKITRSPIIKSQKTGKYFLLPWSDMVKLGVKAGLNKPSGLSKK